MKKNEHVTSEYKISGMHCTSCAINIDFELEDLDGVIESRTHFAKQITTVTYSPDKVRHEDICAAVSRLGYSASKHV